MGEWALTVAILPGLTAYGAGKNTHLPVFPWKQINCILFNLQREGLASNLHTSRGYLQSSTEPGEAGGYLYNLLLLAHSCNKTRSPTAL